MNLRSLIQVIKVLQYFPPCVHNSEPVAHTEVDLTKLEQGELKTVPTAEISIKVL